VGKNVIQVSVSMSYFVFMSYSSNAVYSGHLTELLVLVWTSRPFFKIRPVSVAQPGPALSSTKNEVSGV
jgi:hypothetical protein